MIEFTEKQKKVLSRYPFKATQYYLDLIDHGAGENDPIYRQIMPDEAELADNESSFDPLAENKYSVTSRLIHRYQDRALLLTTGNCLVRCRFCLRKRFWNGSDNNCPEITSAEIVEAVNYVKNHPEIKEILLSGGDVLSLKTEKINELISAFHDIPHINVIRIASRMLVVEPKRFDEELLGIFSKFDKLWLMTHFNHPQEITEMTAAIAKKIVKTGTPILNQTVLLKGVNDRTDIQVELCQKLTAIKIKPHYLFHVDPVQGVRHFATGIETGLEILHGMRGRLSSISTPTFAIDLPNGGGKVALQYNYQKNSAFLNTEETEYIEY
ncbi:MAG: KamA family radical SAM protein [Lentisphaeria bacterium]|nr:KamA family radical SAM protein [Lentisphaeria bacterium]